MKSKKTIFVVDNDEWMRGKLSAVLKGDHELWGAATSKNSRRLLEKTDTNLILFNVKMLYTSGLQMIKVAFKPIISTAPKAQTDRLTPLTAIDQNERSLGGGCMTAAGLALDSDLSPHPMYVEGDLVP